MQIQKKIDDFENYKAEALQTTGEADASRERDAKEDASEEKMAAIIND